MFGFRGRLYGISLLGSGMGWVCETGMGRRRRKSRCRLLRWFPWRMDAEG